MRDRASIDRSTIAPYAAGEPGPFYYARYDHPTGVEAEGALGQLEGGPALLFASGAAACTAAALGLLEPGRTIALAAGAYYGTSRLFASLGRWGLRFVEFDQTGPPPDDADLVWLEAPSNPFLTFPDLEAAAAHPAPVRVTRQSATALELARRLAAHPTVELVRYPGLGPDPLAARSMQGGFGGMLSFDVGADAHKVETSTRLIRNATSLGGVRSTLETRRRWEGERVPEGLIRLSVGLEDVDALWADLEQALARAQVQPSPRE